MPSENPWSAPQPIPGAQRGSHSPALAVQGETLHAVWTQGAELRHASLSDGVWSTAVRIAAGMQPTLAVAPDGRLHCLYANPFAGNLEIFHITFTGDAWTLPLNVSRTRGDSERPALAIAPDGTLYAAWSDTTPGYPAIYYGRYDGAFWSSLPIPNATGNAVALAAGPNGDIHAAWHHCTASTLHYEILCSTLRNGVWSVPAVVSDNPDVHSVYPGLAVDQRNGCHIVWQEEEQARLFGIRQAARLEANWSTPEQLSPGRRDCRLAKVAARGKDLIQVVWFEGRSLRHRARLALPNAGWGTEEIAATGCGPAGDLTLALSASGRVYVAWTGFEEDGSSQLYYVWRKPVLRPIIFMPTINR